MSKQPIAGDRAPSTLAFLLSQVGIHAARRFSERMEEIDLQPPLFRILNLVDLAEGRSQQAIGEAIQVPPSRMVALVDELERRGLVERKPHPSDRRIRALYLTPKGRRLLVRGREIATAHERELTRGMSATDRKRLVELLQQLVDQQTIGKGVHPGLSHKAVSDG
ncbi:MAG TPA: MarR family winged helix-turn-helix transcriptional regulator [Solirubrobacterales bacterium]|jgi:DNA-binding MarR family transcriptional regulator|nr:MarR family winged helix-turn-helix transcriptional regulator [Solirubrobacterales bacterium]